MRTFVVDPNLYKISQRMTHPLAEVRRVEQGYTFKSLMTLATKLGITQLRLADLLGISETTLNRRRKERFTSSESSRLYEIGKLFNKAEVVMGGVPEARHWFGMSNPHLGEKTPLELLRTAPGLELLEIYLVQVSDGISI